MCVTILEYAYTDVIAEDASTITICPNANAALRYHWTLNKRPADYGIGGDKPMTLRLRQEWGTRELIVYEQPLLLP